MKSSQNVLFPGLSWWLLSLIPFVFLGFYATYFSGAAFFKTSATLHIHAAFLIAWIFMVIAQPILILRKKIKLHRTLGKASYVLMPLILITTWLVVRKTYFGILQSPAGLNDAAKESMYIPLVYLFWLLVFYTLAIVNRKQVLFHATYMFAAILTLLGPSLDRILYQVYRFYGFGFNLFAEYAVFVLIDLLLLGLLYYQSKKGYSLKAITISLVIYLAGQLGFIFVPPTKFWESLLSTLL